MKDPRTTDLFDAFAEDLLGEQITRSLIVVGASKVDHLLLEILRRFLLPQIAKPRQPDELLEGDTPLGTFSARIKICRRLGLIDDTLRLALERLRALRNLCAHSVSFDVTTSPAREHVADLRKRLAGRDSYRFTRERYFDTVRFLPIHELQCLLLTLCVLLEAVREKVRRTDGNTSTLRIAAK
jgi:hypothetical protein